MVAFSEGLMMTRSSEMAGRAIETFEISSVERAGPCLDQRQSGARRSTPEREGEYKILNCFSARRLRGVKFQTTG